MAVNSIVADWKLKIGTPAWERACVAEAAGIHKGRAQQKLESWYKGENGHREPPRSLLYAAGALMSFYLCDDDNNEADPDDEEYGLSLIDSPYFKGRGGRATDFFKKGVKLPLWSTVTGPLQWEEDIEQAVEEPAEEPVEEPAQEGPGTKRRKLLGEFSLVQGSAQATPKSNPVWKDRLKETGLSSIEFNRALKGEGLVPYKCNGGHFVQETSSQKLVQLI
jgi:hypothetical protein